MASEAHPSAKGKSFRARWPVFFLRLASPKKDFPDVGHVVLFDFPRDGVEYVRRVGRATRGAHQPGRVTSLLLGRQVRSAGRACEESASDQRPLVGPWNLSALRPLAPLGRGGIQGPAPSRAPQLSERTRPTHPPVCRFSGAGRLRAHADEAQPGARASQPAEGSIVARAARLARHTTPPRCAPAL